MDELHIIVLTFDKGGIVGGLYDLFFSHVFVFFVRHIASEAQWGFWGFFDWDELEDQYDQQGLE